LRSQEFADPGSNRPSARFLKSRNCRETEPNVNRQKRELREAERLPGYAAADWGLPDSVRQSEDGIAPVTAAAGAIRIKDEVKCTFDIVAREQE
jgi:hypothetical protein